MPLFRPSSVSGTCSVSRRSVSGSYSTTQRLPLIVASNRPCSGSGFAVLVNFADDRRRALVNCMIGPQRLDLFRRVRALRIDACEPQRPLDRHLPVAKGGVVENLRLLGLFEVEERLRDAVNICIGQFAVLLAEVLPQRLEPSCRVDELHLTLSVRRACG